MTDSPRILYVGDLWNGGTSLMRAEALEQIGSEVLKVDSTIPSAGIRNLAFRAGIKLGRVIDLVGVNQKILEVARQEDPDIVWIDKGLIIRRETLIRLRKLKPGLRIVHYSLDDMSARHNQSMNYLACIPQYDLHVTNKSYNVPELYEMGAREVLFVNNAFSPHAHTPMNVSPTEKDELGGKVGFIGAFEHDRAAAIWHLAQNGIPVRVWGEGWGGGWLKWAASHVHRNLVVEARALFGVDYARAISSFDINLCFLRRLNRDLQTTRSVEIPACGGFMLAERTKEHQELFADGEEAVFFESSEELFEKCRFYLDHSQERRAIAEAGRKRCLRSDYSYDRQLQAVLGRLMNKDEVSPGQFNREASERLSVRETL